VAIARAKRLAEVDAGDLAVGHRVHQEEMVDIDRHGARGLADAESIEAMEGVGPELDAGADLAQLARLLQHQRGDALLRQRQCRGEAADAAARDEDPIAHPSSRPEPRAARRSGETLPATG